jgi:hypothetical protein
MHQGVSWIDERHRTQLGVIADRETRHVEDLENHQLQQGIRLRYEMPSFGDGSASTGI